VSGELVKQDDVDRSAWGEAIEIGGGVDGEVRRGCEAAGSIKVADLLGLVVVDDVEVRLGEVGDGDAFSVDGYAI